MRIRSKLKETAYLIEEPDQSLLNAKIIDYNNLPRVSFCIPTFNNEDTLENCLASINNQEYPDVEIVIVDGHSNDKTIEIAKRYTSKIYFDDGKLGSARQTSVEHSTGQIVALFDSDIIIPHKKWLVNAIRYFNYNNKISTVWPMNNPPPNSSITAKFFFNQWKIIMDDRIEKGRGVFGGGNALFIKKYLEEIGGIDKSLHWGEDFDWAQKLKHLGCQVVIIEDPLYHDTMRSLGKFVRKQFTGAKTFTVTGFQLMGLTSKDIFYEQFVLGAKYMIKGLIKDKDVSWFLFPLFVLIRSTVYSYLYIKNCTFKTTLSKCVPAPPIK